MEKKTVKETVRKGAALGLAFLCSIGLLLAGQPDADTKETTLPEPVVIVDDADEDAGDEEKRRAAARIGVKKNARTAVRMLITFPLWAIGSVILWLGKKLLKLTASAVLPPLLHWLGLFLLLCLALWIIAKILFPGIKFKEIFTRHSLCVLFIGSLLLEAGDFFLSRIIDKFDRFGLLYFFVGGIFLIGIALLPAARKQRAKRTGAQEPEEEETSITVSGSAQSGEEA